MNTRNPTTPGSLGILLAALAIGLMSVRVAWAEPTQGDAGDRGHKAKQAEAKQDEKRDDDDDKRRRGGRLTDALFKDIELTDEALEQVREMGRAHMTRVRDWHNEHRDQVQALHQQMRDAREADDDEAADAAKDKLKALFETRPSFGDLFDQMRGVLNTDAEREAFDANLNRLKQAIKERRGKRNDRRDKSGDDQGKDAPDGDGTSD